MHRDLRVDPGNGGTRIRAIGRPEMIDDPRFRTNTDRVRHIEECDGAVAELIAQRTLDEAMAVFQAAE